MYAAISTLSEGCRGRLKLLSSLVLDAAPAVSLWLSLETMVPPLVLAHFRRIVAWHQHRLSAEPLGALCTNRHIDAARRIRGSFKRHWKKRTTRAKAPAATARQAKPRPPAVGRLPCAFPDTVDTAMCTSTGGPRIAAWTPAARTALATPTPLPPRLARYAPTLTSQVTQLKRVHSWHLHRLGASREHDFLFSIGAMSKAVRAWESTGGCGTPPLDVIRSAAWSRQYPTFLATETGHVWSTFHLAPLDARQMASAFHSAWAAPGAEHLLNTGLATESQLRALFGQATDQLAMSCALDRLNFLADGGLRAARAPSVGAIGAGLNLSSLQALRWLGKDAVLAWIAEACPIAAPAGMAFASFYGFSPSQFSRAECAALASADYHTTLEIITLRCAPFSSANPIFPEGVEATLNELAAVLRGLSHRQPLFVIYENTAGLARHLPTLLRVEHLLQTLATGSGPYYKWNVVVTSPANLSHRGQRRKRLFFVARRLSGPA